MPRAASLAAPSAVDSTISGRKICDAQQIGLDLHQQIVGGGAAVDAQVVDGAARRRPASPLTRSTFCSAIASSAARAMWAASSRA